MHLRFDDKTNCVTNPPQHETQVRKMEEIAKFQICHHSAKKNGLDSSRREGRHETENETNYKSQQ